VGPEWARGARLRDGGRRGLWVLRRIQRRRGRPRCHRRPSRPSSPGRGDALL